MKRPARPAEESGAGGGAVEPLSEARALSDRIWSSICSIVTHSELTVDRLRETDNATSMA